MKILNTHTDEAVLAEMGERIARHRLAQQLTQAELAEQAGIGKRTLERVEAGLTAQFSTIVRIFRVLGLLPRLDQALAEPRVRPLEAAARKGKRRQRASGKSKPKPQEPWSWEEGE
jgi:transcriptional regulator with XRE-family HTH domain